MGTSSNGDGQPDSAGPPEGLPHLPPEWGPIVIPDDPAELAAEATLVRRALRRQARRAVWRRRLGLTRWSGVPGPVPVVRLPLLIMSVTLLATLVSLFAVAWPGPPRQAPGPRPPTSRAPGRTMPALDLVAEDGHLVSLRSLLPAVIVFTDGCTCAEELDAATAIAPAEVNVVALTSNRTATSPRQPAGTAGRVRALADPAAELRGFLQLTPQAGAVPALLAARSGEIVRVLPAITATAIADYRAEVAALSTR
jgi:hypothetical protein